MKLKNKIVAVLLLIGMTAVAQKNKSPKVVLITLDGLRWQELFAGADSLLVGNKDYVSNTDELKGTFWRSMAEERRKILLPFVWNTISKMGQIYGNRAKNSKVDLTNTMWFSYPGYNEILTGKADDKNITSNSKINNPNTTVLEMLNNAEAYKGKVAAFGSWDVFPFIINEERSGIPVNAGFEKAKGSKLTDKEEFLNKLQGQTPSPWGSVRLDVFTHNFALEYMEKAHPEVVYISYGETDDFAHDGDYDAYLKAAKNTDGLIEELWNFTQNDSFYKDNTVFLITTDHGRGTQPLDTWKHHGGSVQGAGEVWFISFGKGVANLGEVSESEQLFSNQIAPTVLDVLNIKIDKDKMKGKPINLGKK
ncbi:alkaline phosphatase family protein [Cellulophaga sp. F20128]|uniref:alkaline phosphatase family protein n=1 Tax=Cellulophaga sp. F20128 TaxID=2926413 RepID=UPI001FF438D5|nr:alkaline phosphatase family protein [Cellulophaga sp. F20128]MCK0158828.1 alkaline phosphatase family protein [Cellulophaga sp. F20128]